jgi:D-alanyl-D-alanine carboxypeptidase/D-alanyl-D-alanine-endopeptidase (penicillin-binding protein 4)
MCPIEGAQKFLTNQIGLKKGSFELVNLSGFTRENLLSSSQFVEVLKWAHKTMALSPEFIQSLPIAGADGTLEKRFKGLAGERKVRAKTGLLNGVVALAGFASRGPGEEILFSFIFNGGENEAHVRSVFDNLASQLTE